jgi:hypothetical protein
MHCRSVFPRWLAVMVLASMFVLGGRPAAAQQVLDNRSVIQLTAAGVDPAVIVAAIEGSRSAFSTGVNDLVALSNARVHRDVMLAMQAAVARRGEPKGAPPPRAAAPPAPALPTHFGVFVAREAGGVDPIAEGRLTVERTTDSAGVTTRKLRMRHGPELEETFALGAQPTFLVYLRDPAARVKMFETGTGSGSVGVPLGREIPLRAGPAGADRRAFRVTPAEPLRSGGYAFVIDEDSIAYGFVHARGRVNPPAMDVATALRRARAARALGTRLAPAAAMALVRATLAEEKLPIARDFGPEGVLITRRVVQSGGWFGKDVAVQFAVLVQRTTSGSVIRVAPDVYTSGLPSGVVKPSQLSRTPLVPGSAQRLSDHAQSLYTEIEFNLPSR